ncbi:hypothetical protein TBS_29900 [Thermobispora bispora]|jgi:uncharacterized protein|uniref:DUF917 domain-containing protein n=1 Tax=Thermobispora bispora (strain ATCC 19993 / DSM 43833 / CBS 139.67 / JCM 10125 / KCTC 9307 / NBRC 14880 / R51) TaxID=469371 RepID=D6Y707_THEBD|nr:DUF917 domain-containing protein [Thermobispora bispora]ADG89648.1 protein of unknown function DUF917 [Thermobispora bispora DSM 43833]MDI9579845.1 DUF917 domain-containing protein [Thermobispora sp.]
MMARITMDDVDALARGCAVLGTGGGGDVRTAAIAARRAISAYGEVPLVSLEELDPDALVLPLSGIGAPTVSHEMIAAAEEPVLIRDEVERVFGRPPAAVMSSEIGGANGVAPVAWAARLGLPLLDADAMGRAFPEVQMVSMNVAGIPPTPVVMADAVGNVVTIRPIDGVWSERMARAVCVAAGSSALMADYILTAGELARGAIRGTVRRAIAIGRATQGARDPLAALIAELGAARLITGKLTELERRTTGGFARGTVVIEGTGEDRGRRLTVEIQNENLVAIENDRVRAIVPDLITIVDTLTASAIQTENLRYGQRVTVIAWPCDPLWRTPEGLKIAGPRAFGYDLDHLPVETIAP